MARPAQSVEQRRAALIDAQDYLSEEEKRKKKEEEERKRREREAAEKAEKERRNRQIAEDLARKAAEKENPLQRNAQRSFADIAKQEKEKRRAEEKKLQAQGIAENLVQKSEEKVNPFQRNAEQNVAAIAKKEEEKRKAEEVKRLYNTDVEAEEKRLSEMRAKNLAKSGTAAVVSKGTQAGRTGKVDLGFLENKDKEKEAEDLEREILRAKEVQRQAKWIEAQDSSEKMAKGREGYAAWEEAKAKRKENGKSTFEQVIDATWNAPDMSSPAGMFQQAVNVHREDTSENEPNDDWTYEQKRTFGYFWILGDYESAAEYAREVNNAIRSGKKKDAVDEITEMLLGNRFSRAAADVASIPASILSGAGYLDKLAQQVAQGYYTESSLPVIEDLREAFRTARAQQINSKSGTLGKEWGILSGKGLGDLYSVGMGAADSLFAAAAGGKPGALISAFSSSASSATNDALLRGADLSTALGYGTFVGAAELLPEYLSVDSLFKLGSAKNLGKFFKNVGQQAATEGLEGTISSISGALADDIIMGELSKFNQDINAYMMDGYTREEAEQMAAEGGRADIILDALGEAIGGGMSGAAVSAYKNTIGKQSKPPVPFDGKAVPGSEAEMVAAKIEEIENRPISEAEKAAKMEEVKAAAEAFGKEQGLVEEARKFEEIHKARAAEIDRAVEVGRKLGVSVSFDENIAGNGIHTSDGRIFINPNTENPVMQVLVHELTHDIETSGLYENFSGKILDYAKNVQGVDLKQMERAVIEDYREAGQELTPELADREIVAKFAETYLFTDQKAIDRLCDTEPNLFRRIKYWIEDAIAKFRGTEQERFLVDTQRLYERALATRGERTGINGQESEGRSYEEMARENEYEAAVNSGDMETAQRFVDEAAKEAGYDSPMLYHGTGAFGFTEFDLSKMDDKRSIFLTDNPKIASTYSGVEGKREIGKKEKTAENLSVEELAKELNRYPGESEMQFTYDTWNFEKQNKLIQDINKEIDKLKSQVGKQIEEYAEKMAVDFDDKDAKIHKQLVGLKEKLENYRYKELSTPIYILLHKTDVFNKNAEEIAEFERNIRLLNKFGDEAVRGNYEVIVQSGLDGYTIELFTPENAKTLLEVYKGRGNYGLYADLGRSLEIDAEGQLWNNVSWTPKLGFELDDVFFELLDDSYYILVDKKTDKAIAGSTIEANEYTRKMTEQQRNNFMLDKAKKSFEIEAEDAHSTRDIGKLAKRYGYDSVVFKGLRDNGGRNSNVDYDETANIYIIFDPHKAKSADPVTYDDDGNVIPLSERFKPEKKDIRYSAGRSYDEMREDLGTEKGKEEIVSAEITGSAKRVLELHTPKRKPQSTASQVNLFAEETIPPVEVPQTKKSADFERRYQRTVENAVASVFGVPRSDIKGDIRPIVEEISADLKAGKEISDGQIDAVYKAAFDDGIISEEFPQYQDTRKYIRSTPIYVDKKTRDEFGDDYAFRDFARSNFGSIRFSTDPRDVHLDEFFDEVAGLAPEFFDSFETDPKSQLESLSDFMEQTKKQYYGLSEVYSGSDLADFEKWAKTELRNYFEDFKKGIDIVSRYERDRQIRATNKAREMNSSASFDEAKAVMESGTVFEKKKALEHAKAKNLLGDTDRILVKRLLEGTMTEADVMLQNAGNVEGILEVYRAEKEYKEARAPFDRYRIAYKAALQHDAIEATELSDEWNDKKIGAFYSRETAERNIRDITKNGKLGGEKILEGYFRPVHENEAMKTRWINDLNRRAKEIGFGKMNRWERAYTQMIGENAAFIAEGKITKHNEAEHAMLNERIENILDEHGDKIDKGKCEKAAAGFMEIYEDILSEWNDERIRRGQEPVGKIEGYFPHFVEAKPETVLQKVFSVLGFDIGSSKLPTDIAGRTADRKPNSKYNPFANRRTSDTTDYDVLKGFDSYIRAVGDNIFHTEDIQKLRALSDTIRTKYGSAEIEKRIEEIQRREDLSEADKDALIDSVFKNAGNQYHLSNLVVWLDEYTNILAGKKSRGDREAEYQMGREVYDISKALEGRIAANMIGYNVSTPIMNLVPLFQATADISPADIVSSVMQTGIGALKKDSYISDNSDFVANRLGADSVYKQNYSLFTAENMKDAVEKIQDGGAFGMELVDRIVSESLVRARVTQNMRDRGMEAEEAFAEADEWAAGLIADRSLGALPTVFNIKNPIVKAFSMFQVEANNQYSYIFKDAGKYKIDKAGTASTIFGQLAFWTSMALCNALGDELLGRDNIVPDPIGITADFIEKLQKGEAVGDVALDTATNMVEQIPFVGGLFGGGRVPISTALPDFEQISKLFNPEVSGDKKREILRTALLKPTSYLLAPSGAGQLWKTGLGVNQLIQGGAFGIDNEGNRYLKFPQSYDPESIIKTILFGQYASDRGQQYIDSGFRDKLSAKQTEQMELAESWGISNEEFYDLVFGLKPYSKKEEKQEVLFENENFTAGEKGILEQILFGTDHTDKEAFYVSGLTETEKRLYEEGFYGGELDRLEKAIKSGDKNEDKIANIIKELGCSEAEAFEILQKRNGEWVRDVPEDESARAQGAADFYGMSAEDYLSVYNYRNFGEKKEDVVENLMAAKGWDRETAEENWNKVFLYEYSREDLLEERAEELDTSQNWYEVDDYGFFTARNILKTVEGEKDEFGNTVSGSKKAAAISAIAEALGIDENEAAIYYLAAKGDLVLSASDLSSAKQADLKTAVSYGWTERQFLDAVNIIKLSGTTKKDDIINALIDAGCPYEMAIGYYNLSKNYDYWKR